LAQAIGNELTRLEPIHVERASPSPLHEAGDCDDCPAHDVIAARYMSGKITGLAEGRRCIDVLFVPCQQLAHIRGGTRGCAGTKCRCSDFRARCAGGAGRRSAG